MPKIVATGHALRHASDPATLNGRHERMHLTLTREFTRPAGRPHPAATSQVRRLHRRTKPARPHEALEISAQPRFRCLRPPLSGHARAALSLPWPYRNGHQLRLSLPLLQEDQIAVLLSRPWAARKWKTESGSSALYITIWVVSIWGENFAAPGKPLWAKSVTYVLRMVF